MASFKEIVYVGVTTIMLLVASTSAVDYVVGDDSGWTINFDYQAWAQDKSFRVGDRLVFTYPAGVHNVFKVNGADFRQCTAPVGAVPLTSGNDVVALESRGKKWYLCGVAQHCAVGNQKLGIVVAPNPWSPLPSPSPAPSPLLSDDVSDQNQD
ncbi:blue copper protein 1b-like [Cannabis sativa]|uniref:blue copper protein 1b-like n=1 Tax=Cannabis sativa TaxID=3483 RepID=UPI0029CAA3AA|nr:blue copper protein 1b-like [Cannabis sativa]